MVNFFTVTSGKLIECQKQEIGKLIGCQCGKQIQCQVVNFFIDIHNQEFFPTSDYAPKNEIDFEVYPDGDITSPNYESEIWIAVVKK